MQSLRGREGKSLSSLLFSVVERVERVSSRLVSETDLNRKFWFCLDLQESAIK